MTVPRSTPGFTFPDPAVQQAAKRLAEAAELSLARAVLNRSDPKGYPLPNDPNSLERRFRTHVDRLPRARRIDLTRKFDPPRGTGSRGAAGLRTKVDLRTKESILEQLHALPPVKPADSDLVDPQDLIDKILADLPGLIAGADGAAAAGAKSLQLRLRRAECVEPTALEPGRDEISLGCIVFDELGNTTSTPAHSLGDFKRGEVKDYSAAPKVLHTIDLAGAAFPKTYAALPVVAEIDFGDFAELLLMSAATSATTAATWIAAGILGGGPLLVLMGLMFAGSAVLNGVVGLLGRDDVLELPGYGPIASVEAGATTFAGGSAASPACDVRITDRGADYRLKLDYLLVA